MRWIVYTLLGFNLAYLTYNLQVHGTAARRADVVAEEPVTESGSVNRLPLLSEVGEGALRRRGEQRFAAIDEDAGARRDETERAAADSERAAASGAAVSEPEADAGTRGRDGTRAGRAGGAEQSDAVESTGESAARAGDATPPPLAEGAPSVSEPRVCLTLGPLDADAPVDAIGEWLAARGADVDVRTDERREVALYWIYFPPRETRAAAVAEVDRMREQGIDDIIVVPKGDMENAISLGVFSREQTRDRRLRQLARHGYEPSISPRYRTSVATWIEAVADPDDVDAERLLEVWPGLEIDVKPCLGRADAAGEIGPGEIADDRGASYNPDDAPRGSRRFHFSDQRDGPSPVRADAATR